MENLLKNWSLVLLISSIFMITMQMINEVAFENFALSTIVFIYLCVRFSYLFGEHANKYLIRIGDWLITLLQFIILIIMTIGLTQRSTGISVLLNIYVFLIFIVQLIACFTPTTSQLLDYALSTIGRMSYIHSHFLIILLVSLNVIYIFLNIVIPDSFSIWCLLALLPSIVIISFLLIPKTKNIVLYNLNCRALGFSTLFICAVTGSLLLIGLCPSYYTYYRYFFNTPVYALFDYYALLCSILLFYGLRKCEENDYPHNNFHLIKNWENHYKEDEIKEQVFPKNFSKWANK